VDKDGLTAIVGTRGCDWIGAGEAMPAWSFSAIRTPELPYHYLASPNAANSYMGTSHGTPIYSTGQMVYAPAWSPGSMRDLNLPIGYDRYGSAIWDPASMVSVPQREPIDWDNVAGTIDYWWNRAANFVVDVAWEAMDIAIHVGILYILKKTGTAGLAAGLTTTAAWYGGNYVINNRGDDFSWQEFWNTISGGSISTIIFHLTGVPVNNIRDVILYAAANWGVSGFLSGVRDLFRDTQACCCDDAPTAKRHSNRAHIPAGSGRP